MIHKSWGCICVSLNCKSLTIYRKFLKILKFYFFGFSAERFLRDVATSYLFEVTYYRNLSLQLHVMSRKKRIEYARECFAFILDFCRRNMVPLAKPVSKLQILVPSKLNAKVHLTKTISHLECLS